MKNLYSQKFPAYLTYQLFVSPAFRDLRPAAKDVLILLYFEIKMASGKARLKKYTPMVSNRREIILPYREIFERLGYSNKTIWESFRQLLAHGFIEVVKHGGGARGDHHIYGISEKWRKWKPGDVILAIRKNGRVGWQCKKNKQKQRVNTTQ